MNEEMPKEWKDILSELSRRTTVDPEFRELALRDAKGALSQISSKPIPAWANVKFVDNYGPVKTIPLPDPLFTAAELSDAELELVAGGVSGSCTGSWSKSGSSGTVSGTCTGGSH